MNKIGNVTVAKIVDANLLDSCFLNASLQLMLNSLLDDRKEPLIVLQRVMPVNEIFDFISQELRNINRTNRFFCLWCRNNILTIQALVRLRDEHQILREIKIALCQCQHLSFPAACPVQDLEHHIVLVFRCNG